jgi:hypothetical protein
MPDNNASLQCFIQRRIINAMTVKLIAYWIVFAIAFVAFQVPGFLSLTFAGVHSNTVPLLRLVFLLPGGHSHTAFDSPPATQQDLPPQPQIQPCTTDLCGVVP